MSKLRVGVLGATGFVGQHYLELLKDHPLFEVVWIAASDRSAGSEYGQLMQSRNPIFSISENYSRLGIHGVTDLDSARRKQINLVFNAAELDTKAQTAQLELDYAKAEIPVFSNSSANRFTRHVPLLIPEINSGQLGYIAAFREENKLQKGFIVAKPNCSVQSYLAPTFALSKFRPTKAYVTTVQATSGAGTFDPKKLGVERNVIPYIKGEEDKSEQEPDKILGYPMSSHEPKPRFIAHCWRGDAPVGHMASVYLEFKHELPSLDEIIRVWTSFKGEPELEGLYFAPSQPIHYTHEPNRPQPQLDSYVEKGMAVVVGGLRMHGHKTISFNALSNNLVRGAAGGGILSAELAHKLGYL